MRGYIPYIEPKTNHFKFCSPTINLNNRQKICPNYYDCHYSSLLKTNICCINSKIEKNIFKNSIKKISEKPIANELICEKGIPYFIGKKPQTCTTSVCPEKFRCVFSKIGRNYYCCSKDNAGI